MTTWEKRIKEKINDLTRGDETLRKMLMKPETGRTPVKISGAITLSPSILSIYYEHPTEKYTCVGHIRKEFGGYTTCKGDFCNERLPIAGGRVLNKHLINNPYDKDKTFITSCYRFEEIITYIHEKYGFDAFFNIL